jgi:anaerobic selenocysteine-containing dehydrogenase
MPSVTRRGFIKWTSVGIAATGALGALAPVGAALAQPAPARPTPAGAPVPTLPALGGEPFVVYISDPSTGAGSILVGERSIPFTNGAVVQSLRQAIG